MQSFRRVLVVFTPGLATPHITEQAGNTNPFQLDHSPELRRIPAAEFVGTGGVPVWPLLSGRSVRITRVKTGELDPLAIAAFPSGGFIRPVLKHGPRSLARKRASG